MIDEFGGHWITTYTGKQFHFLDPQPDEIDIVDIAHALSLTCRFGGQCKEFYSVAEHCIHVANIVAQECKLLALLHDASEAYLPDLPRPMKAELLQFKRMERKILWSVWRKFLRDNRVSLWLEDGGPIKEADNILLATEARDLMDNTNDWALLPKPLTQLIVPYDSEDAERIFLCKFYEYSRDDRVGALA